MAQKASGPLSGVKVIEFAGIGPGPFCAMLLSDMGAEVLRIDRRGAQGGSKFEIGARGRRSAALNLKKPEGVAAALRLIAQADVVIEGFRPGVMERLGLGPDVCLARNPKLVYGRMTGWGQTGPLASAAGHDINYIALTGALAAIGEPGGKPVPPLNLIGDFGGGALYLAMGIAAALFESAGSGKGQVIDCAMTEGATSLMSYFYAGRAAGVWSLQRGTNVLDGGSHFYNVYETADGKYISIGSIEPQFYALLLEKAGLADDPEFKTQMDPAHWPALKDKLEKLFKTRSRADWTKLMEGTDICFAPVLDMDEAPHHPHNRAREAFVELSGVVQPNVAPRFSRTPSAIQGPPPKPGQHTEQALLDWGFTPDELNQLKAKEAV